MKDLSVFVDESGDFGPYDYHTPYYIVTLVFHDQDMDVTDAIRHFERSLTEMDLPAQHIVHAGPLIRREELYLMNARRFSIEHLTFCAQRKSRIRRLS